MRRMLIVSTLAAIAAFTPALALADNATNGNTSSIVASVFIPKSDSRSAELELSGAWLPRHQESQAFWDKFQQLVYPGGAAGN